MTDLKKLRAAAHAARKRGVRLTIDPAEMESLIERYDLASDMAHRAYEIFDSPRIDDARVQRWLLDADVALGNITVGEYLELTP